ncbi:hypothetical protein J4208_02020 [Candidatus Woesearchaeota archaeon]|nr:hypothetical protein [Candidatus Woesearchaeota archaeon]
MKHTRSVTLLLVLLFIAAQIVGLYVVSEYVTFETVTVGNMTYQEEVFKPLPYDLERPQFAKETSYLPIIAIILISTLLVLLIVKFGARLLWKVWFFLSVWFCMMIAFGAFLDKHWIALLIALILALLKVFRIHPFIHNLTELFIYGGLAAVFTPVLSLFSISILLVIISIYDFIAVRKTKHMVDMAEFQSKMQLFAGLLIPYGKKGEKTAILGGGDIGFPLLFASVVLMDYSFWAAMLVVLGAALALSYLLVTSEKNKYYPAMPILSAGCFLGLGLAYLFLL